MGSTCNIVIKSERNPKKEVVLYRHNDGHPDVMIEMLSKVLYNTYMDFERYGDTDWFLESNIVASKIIMNSVPKLPPEILELLDTLDDTNKKKFLMYTKVDIPTIVPEPHRVSNCNYEYVVTLKEVIDSLVFRGYNLEVIKLGNNKKVQDVLSIDTNLNAVDKVK